SSYPELVPSYQLFRRPSRQNSRPMHPLDHFISTRMRLRSGFAAPRTCPNGERAVRSRKSMTSSVMISPGNRLGIPGGYAASDSADTRPMHSEVGTSRENEKYASRSDITASPGIGSVI